MTSAKSGPISHIFHRYIQKESVEKYWIKTTTSPQICCCITLRKYVFNIQYTLRHYRQLHSS